MAKLIYWCSSCAIPIIEQSECPICGGTSKQIASNGVCNPVFTQEKRLMSCILGEEVEDKNVWYLGGGRYLVDGKKVRLPFVEYYKSKKHLEIADKLRDDISNDSSIHNLELYLQANQSHLNNLIYNADEYIRTTITECNTDPDHKYIPTVSFSGGKDSTVVSQLVRDALQTGKVIHFFGDTTLEFPCTHEYVEKQFRNENPYTPIIPSETENDFFKLCKVFGPPSRYERWCCTIFKTSNLNNEYYALNGNSLTFLGIRRSESKERAKYEQTQYTSKIGSQVNAMPIIDWDDSDVWLYILYKGISFNNAYKWGYKRVGCWCCPNNSEWSMMLTEIYYPELSLRWRNMVYDFAVKTKKDDIDDYIENCRWKSRRGASGLEARNVEIADTPCNLSDRARNIIIKKPIMRDVIEFFKPFGNLDIIDKEDATYITVNESEIKSLDGTVKYPTKKVCELVVKFGTPVLKVLPVKGIDTQTLINRLKCQMRKYQYCIRCTACDSVCPYGAISTIGSSGRYVVDETKCKKNMSECFKCIAKFYNGCITCQVLSGRKQTHTDENFEM